MRKRSCNRLFDNIFWYAVYLLPLIIYIGVMIALSANGNLSYDDIVYYEGVPYAFDNFMVNFCGENNPIYTVFYDLFSDESVIGFQLFDYYGVLKYLAYFVSVYILHLMVDFILFIPRLCHKWMKAFTQGDD